MTQILRWLWNEIWVIISGLTHFKNLKFFCKRKNGPLDYKIHYDNNDGARKS